MSVFEDINTIKLLQDLLKPPGDQSSDSEDEHLPACGLHKFGPGDIRPSASASAKNSTEATSTGVETNPRLEQPKPTSLEEWERLQERDVADVLDRRRSPEHRFSYQQDVSTEDIFLQMGNKTSATSSCSIMVLTVEMPDETVGIERMQLDVTAEAIDLQTPVYRLRMALPHSVDPDAGRAEYDAERRRLTMRLRMRREFDFVNF